MSVFGRRISGRVVFGVVAVFLVAALLPVMTMAPAREIVLVARDMSFYLEGRMTEPNPVIEVKAGERIRVVLRNEERGIVHDFAVPALRTGIDGLRWNQSGEVTFGVPDAPGSYEYVCRPHLLMMKGTLVVVAP